MKKSLLFVFFLTLIINVLFGQIAPSLGGQISWRCLPNGQYIFSAVVFGKCNISNVDYRPLLLTVVSSSLPRNSPNGQLVDRITLNPDRANFQAAGNTSNTTPLCNSNISQPLLCANDKLKVAYYYESDPIRLFGSPPASGWNLFITPGSFFQGNFENLNSAGSYSVILRATMFDSPDSSAVGVCFDSSPIFSAQPATYVCRNYEFTYNHTAIDEDLDSLVYSWDRPYYNDPLFLIAYAYNSGFSPTNPTPDQSFNINNIPATLDPLTGVTKLAIYSGSGDKSYWTSVQVDSYRKGIKIASVYRDVPISIFDCPNLPVSTNLPNNAPEVFINGVPIGSTITTVTAGQTVSIPIQVVDNDRVTVAPFSQLLTMTPEGVLFTRSKNGPSKKYPGDPVGEPCNIIGTDVNPCAYLRGNPAPFIDQTATPPVTVVKGLGVIGVEFVWQTDCKHIISPTATPGANEGIYNFVLRVQDDHCPVPGINYPTVTVRVKDPLPLTEPIMKGVSVLLNGTTRYSWVPPIDSARQFNPPDKQNDHYEAFYAEPANSQSPAFWFSENTFITNYQQENSSSLVTPYDPVNLIDPNSELNILAAKGSQLGQSLDHYVRMRTLSGCSDTNASIWSEPARIMKLTASPAGVNPNPIRSTTQLTWNRAKPLNARTYPYFVYESPTHFYIHANDSISNGGVAVQANWYLVGDTNATTFEVGATTCSDYVGFRVEARDTVITWKEGSSIQGDSLDTLYFSTFSTIDTLFMEARSGIPIPSFDTLKVLADGSVLLRINLKGKLTTGRYNIYNNSITPSNLLTSVNALTDSVVVLSGAQSNIKNIILEAIDACDSSNKVSSTVYNSMLPTGNLSNSCKGEYTLNWNKPGGFPSNVSSYKVYVDVGNGNGFVLDTIITDRNDTGAVVAGVSRGKTLRYKVEALDSRGAVNSSAIHEFTAPSNLATDKKVYPPTPRCSYVNADGSVAITWIPAVDTVNNFANYNIQYKKATTTTWTDIPLNDDDNLVLSDSTYTITNINAQNEQYDFRITSLAGCDGKQLIAYEEISSIYLLVTPRQSVAQVISDLTWNPSGIDYTGIGNFFTLSGAENGQALTTIGAANFGGMYEDIIVMDSCRLPVSYRLNYTDNAFVQDGFTCSVQSNVANAVHIDSIPPEAENLAMLSFNRTTGQLEAYWLGSAAGADSLEFFTKNVNNTAIKIDTTVALDQNASLGMHAFSTTILDGRSADQAVGARAKDRCDNKADDPISYHQSMDVEVEWKSCDSINLVTWTKYVGLNPNFAVEYQVFYSEDGGANWMAAPNSIGIDNNYEHFIAKGGKTYHYYVQGKSLDPNTPSWVLPNSNIDSVYSVYEDSPQYGYLTYATVLPQNLVELNYYRDSSAPVKSYIILRGETPMELNPIAVINANTLVGTNRVNYIDNTAEVNEREYYYRITSQNECNNVTSTSNFGRTIRLVVESDDEAMKNTLRWNRYLKWDSTVAYYNIYRSSAAVHSTEVYKKILPEGNYDYHVFVDDLSNAVNSKGTFFYRVEAVQGAVLPSAVNGAANNLTPQVSNSNRVESLQSPLMYVPNAFAPNGVNKTFGPKGQFFDYTQFEMTIYNRWGEQIYQSRNINQGWDGTVDGKDASLGSYVYMIRYKDGDGKEKRKKGTVTLIR